MLMKGTGMEREGLKGLVEREKEADDNPGSFHSNKVRKKRESNVGRR